MTCHYALQKLIIMTTLQMSIIWLGYFFYLAWIFLQALNEVFFLYIHIFLLSNGIIGVMFL